MCHVLEVRDGIMETGGHCSCDMEKRAGKGEPGEEGKGPVSTMEVLVSIIGTNRWEGGTEYTVFTFSHSSDSSPTRPYGVSAHILLPYHTMYSLKAGRMGLLFL